MNRTKNTVTDSAILISKKAYNDFAGRIRDIFTNRLNAPNVTAEAMNALDRYVRGEEISIDKMDRIVQIAFLMIQSEIDKAITRSKAARLRAAIRKMKKNTTVETSQSEDAQIETLSPAAECSLPPAAPAGTDNHAAEAESEEEIPIVMNRRARREYEREMRRELKREQRRKLRENSGLTTGYLLRRG